ncbi:MAG: HAD family hydrolase [bacterium]
MPARRFDAVLFDLGDTLVGYYRRPQARVVMAEGLVAAEAALRAGGETLPDPEAARGRFMEIREAPDWRVRPLEGRLATAYGLRRREDDPLLAAACRAFLAPTFARAELFPDSLPVLRTLRERGLKLAIVSNMPCGCPKEPWEEEIARHGIAEHLEAFVTCRDVGWRKPVRAIFDRAVADVGVPAARCLFVGDEPVWDVQGAREAGMEGVLVSRWGGAPEGLPDLRALLDRVG